MNFVNFFVTNEVKKLMLLYVNILCKETKSFVGQGLAVLPRPTSKSCAQVTPSDPVPSASALWQLVEKIFKSTLQ